MAEFLAPLTVAFVTALAGVLSAWTLARVRSGRLTRTLGQAAQVIEIMERCLAARDRLDTSSVASKEELESLLLFVARSIREDYVAEREILPQFEASTNSISNALLLKSPHRAIFWVPYILFYTCILFVVFVGAIILVAPGEGDFLAILIAGVVAVALRIFVGLLDK